MTWHGSSRSWNLLSKTGQQADIGQVKARILKDGESLHFDEEGIMNATLLTYQLLQGYKVRDHSFATSACPALVINSLNEALQSFR